MPLQEIQSPGHMMSPVPRGQPEPSRGLSRRRRTLDASVFLLPGDPLLLFLGQKVPLLPSSPSLACSSAPCKTQTHCPLILPPEPSGSGFSLPPPSSPLVGHHPVLPASAQFSSDSSSCLVCHGIPSLLARCLAHSRHFVFLNKYDNFTLRDTTLDVD